MTRFEDGLRQRLRALGASAQEVDLLDRSLATSRRLRRIRAASAATVSALLVAGIGAGAWAAVAPDRDGSSPSIATSTPTPMLTPTASPSAATAGTSVAPTGSSTSAVLPLVHCAEKGEPPVSPTATSTPVPRANAGKGLSVYTDPQGRLSVLAPDDWICRASTAADGTLSLVVVPAGTSTAPPHPYTSDNRQGVAAILAPARTTEATDLTCAIMPSASSKPTAACPHKAPSEEKHSPDAPNVVEFFQPAGVVGDGALGGGTFTTFGRIITSASQGGNEVAFVSCALPDSQGGLCQDVATGFAPFGTYYPLPGG